MVPAALATDRQEVELGKTGEKTLSRVIRERRATEHFQAAPVDGQDLRKILEAGRLAPSGYNLQPWRFIVVQDAPTKEKLQAAAMKQPKIGEAPVIVVACGDPKAWREGDMEAMLDLAREHGYGDEKQREAIKKDIENFLGHIPGEAGGMMPSRAVWVNRQVMIAFTHMMLMAEALGYDTAPMEGFYENKVREALGIPPHVRVVALLAIGHLRGKDKVYAGRFPLEKIVFSNHWGSSY